MRRKLPEGLILKLNFEEQVSARLRKIEQITFM